MHTGWIPVVMLDFGLGKGEEAENFSVRPPRRTHYSDDNWTGFAHPLAICATPLRLIYLLNMHGAPSPG